MIEGSGSGAGSVSLANGSGCGSGRPKNIWILIRMRIQICNTGFNLYDFFVPFIIDFVWFHHFFCYFGLPIQKDSFCSLLRKPDCISVFLPWLVLPKLWQLFVFICNLYPTTDIVFVLGTPSPDFNSTRIGLNTSGTIFPNPPSVLPSQANKLVPVPPPPPPSSHQQLHTLEHLVSDLRDQVS